MGSALANGSARSFARAFGIYACTPFIRGAWWKPHLQLQRRRRSAPPAGGTRGGRAACRSEAGAGPSSPGDGKEAQSRRRRAVPPLLGRGTTPRRVEVGADSTPTGGAAERIAARPPSEGDVAGVPRRLRR
eukprot:101892-Prorocentrum_minimum.AAC.8